MLAILKRSIVTRDQKIFLKLYKQLVRPHLEYAAIIWNLPLNVISSKLKGFKSGQPDALLD